MQERVRPRPNTIKITVEIDTKLASAASAMDIDLGPLLENAIEARIKAKQSSPLSEEDRASLDSYNKFVAKNGTLADAFRKL